jgi:glycogen synthase
MRIALVTPFFPPHPGGLERHVKDLAKGLSGLGFEVSVITSNIPAAPEDPESEFDVLRLPSTQIGADIIPRGLSRALREVKPDIVHTHAPISIISTLASRASRQGIPIVNTYHGDYYKSSKVQTLIRDLRNSLQLPYVLSKTRFVITLTRFDRDLLVRFGISPMCIRTIRPGIDLSRFSPKNGPEGGLLPLTDGNDKTRPFIGPDDIMVFNTGRIVREKGVQELIWAFRTIAKQVPKAKLVISGTGLALEEMKDLVRKYGLKNRIKFLGWVPQNVLMSCYQRADVFVLPSFSEGLPYVILEAMAYGKAVVASNVSGLNEVITDGVNGMLFDLSKEGDLAEVLTKLLMDPKKRLRLGQTALENCKANYSKERWLGDTVKLYEEII